MKMDRFETETALIRFIVDHLVGQSQDFTLGPEEDLLGGSLLDSLGVMRLVRHIEEQHAVMVPPADVTIEHFQNVRAIAAYVSTLGSNREHERLATP